jgi:hypothetical protein
VALGSGVAAGAAGGIHADCGRSQNFNETPVNALATVTAIRTIRTTTAVITPFDGSFTVLDPLLQDGAQSRRLAIDAVFKQVLKLACAKPTAMPSRVPAMPNSEPSSAAVSAAPVSATTTWAQV